MPSPRPRQLPPDHPLIDAYKIKNEDFYKYKRSQKTLLNEDTIRNLKEAFGYTKIWSDKRQKIYKEKVLRLPNAEVVFLKKYYDLLIPSLDNEDSHYAKVHYVCKDGKRGFIDKDGLEIVEPKYAEMPFFHDCADVIVKDTGKWGTIGYDGKEIIPAKYDYTSNASRDYSMVKLNKKWGIVTASGDRLLECIYDEIYKITHKSDAKNRNAHSLHLALVKRDNKLQCVSIQSGQQKDIPKEMTDNYILQARDKTYGIITPQGHSLPQFDQIRFVEKNGKNNIVVLYQGYRHELTFLDRKQQLRPFMKAQADEVIKDPDTTSAISIEINDCRQLVLQEGKWILVDKHANKIIENEYEDYKNIYNAPLLMLKKNGKWGVVNYETGDNVTRHLFDEVYYQPTQNMLQGWIKKDNTIVHVPINI